MVNVFRMGSLSDSRLSVPAVKGQVTGACDERGYGGWVGAVGRIGRLWTASERRARNIQKSSGSAVGSFFAELNRCCAVSSRSLTGAACVVRVEFCCVVKFRVIDEIMC